MVDVAFARNTRRAQLLSMTQRFTILDPPSRHSPLRSPTPSPKAKPVTMNSLF